ncbi:DnaJ -like protein [Halotydeus destructor]|nr:DnaJ -like protein [Halotydeus destructor]
MWYLKLVSFLVLVNYSHAFIEGIYCGVENCYDVLGLTRQATKEEVTKSYRKLARKFHPDMHRNAEAKAEASERFLKIASAYETLTDAEARKEYDYMLDNPEEVYRHYYYYFRRRYSPKVDVRIVLVVTITIISAAQYYGSMSKYNEAIDYFLTVPKYKTQAQQIAKEDGLLSTDKKKNKGKSRDDVRLEEEAILRKIIEDKMDIKGSYEKPTYRDVLWVQLILLPYTLLLWLKFYSRWFFKFTLMKEEYGDEEKMYIMRRNMKLSQGQWDQLEDDEKEEYMEQELWLPENFAQWKQERDDDNKAKLAESASYKRYRRWLKKGGAGQITFGED